MLQLGRCAFTAACSTPGPRFRLRGTDREFCGQHARTLQISIETPAPAESGGAFAGALTSLKPVAGKKA
jgi:hypothetical protein